MFQGAEEYKSAVENLSSTPEALSSIPSITDQERMQQESLFGTH